MAHRDVVLACYRSLLRWSRLAERVPFSVKREHLKLVSPSMADAKVTVQDAATFKNVLRWSFRTNIQLTGEEAKEAVGKAVLALKMLNTTYSKQLKEVQKRRQEHADATGVWYCIGQVVKHKTDGYRGVIHGWDRVCRYPQYVTDIDVDFVQPFYSIIPDENDAIRSFGGPRMMQYVPQENVSAVAEPFKISNRAILFHFDAYCPKSGRYIPKQQLRYEYPGDYPEHNIQPCDRTEDERKTMTAVRTPRRRRPMQKSHLRSDRSTTVASRSTTGNKDLPRVKGSDKAT